MPPCLQRFCRRNTDEGGSGRVLIVGEFVLNACRPFICLLMTSDMSVLVFQVGFNTEDTTMNVMPSQRVSVRLRFAWLSLVVPS